MIKKNPTWRDEFPPEFDVPELISGDPELEDVSWHNDVCPSFTLKRLMGKVLETGAVDVRLWCEHPDPDKREWDIETRYNVYDHVAEIQHYNGNDPAEAVRALKNVEVTDEER